MGKNKKEGYNTVTLPQDTGIHGLRNGIIKQAVKDLRNKYVKFLNQPSKETFTDFDAVRKFFVIYKCDGLVEYETSDYIYEKICKDIESYFDSVHTEKLKKKYSYY